MIPIQIGKAKGRKKKEENNKSEIASGKKQACCGLQGSTKRWSPGLVNFVAVLAYYFCLALPAAFTQPGDHL